MYKRQTKNRPTATAAPSPAAKTWDREPTTVFGVLLGGPIPRSSFPACVKPTRENDYARPSETCLQEPEYGYPIAYLKGLGISGVADEASLHLLDEKVVSVHVSFRQQTYGAMKSILIERYGPPSKIESMDVVTRGGANLTSEVASWEGVQNEITLVERVGKVDQSVAAFTNRQMQKLQQDRKNSATSENAKKF